MCANIFERKKGVETYNSRNHYRWQIKFLRKFWVIKFLW